MPNSVGKRRSFFRWLRPFLDGSKVLMGDWNAILDTKIDRGGWDASGPDQLAGRARFG